MSESVVRVVRFTAPPPSEVARRCEASAELIVKAITVLHREQPTPLAERLLLAEELRGVVVDLVLAAGWLADAVSAEPTV